MKKNEIYDLEIIDNGANFEGIARHDNKVIFVPNAIRNEKIRATIIKDNKSYSIAKIDDFIVKSKNRVEPFCSVYKRCGGCSAQHILYDEQLKIKKDLVKNLLDKQKLKYPKLENTIGMGLPFYYRNKVQYPIRKDKNKNTVIGFYAKRSHEIIENSCCYIQNRVIDMVSKQVFEYLLKYKFEGYDETNNKGDIRHIVIRRGYHTKEIMIVIVVNKKSLLDDSKFSKISQDLVSSNREIKSIFLNLNESKTNEILGDELKLIYGEKYISDYIGSYKYYISPKSFFQVNTLQAEVLYSVLKDNLRLKGNEILFDLYSGVGSIGIFLSDMVQKVYGIEIQKEAVEMANLNLKLNNVNNAEYIAGSVEDKIVEYKNRNIVPDVIVVDPPRSGLDPKSIEYIINFKARKIGYVSCNPATLARDLKLLENYYDIVSIKQVDMFPNTSHVEVCALLELKNCQLS